MRNNEKEAKFTNVKIGWYAKLKNDEWGRISGIGLTLLYVDAKGQQWAYRLRDGLFDGGEELYKLAINTKNLNTVFPVQITEIFPPAEVDIKITLKKTRILRSNDYAILTSPDGQFPFHTIPKDTLDETCVAFINQLAEDVAKYPDRR